MTREGEAEARRPVAIATWRFGELAIVAGGAALARGEGALRSVELGINAVELAPEVGSVGFGGLPNARGDVELDAMIMEGRKLKAGAVAGLSRCPRAISVARAVLERSPHTFLVGQGADAFAAAQGFEAERLLSDAARERWERWRIEREPAIGLQHDTVGMLALDAAGELAAGCSTSGYPFKAPGRVGDSPLIGAGAYCDGAVGAAAATGHGDDMMRFCLSFAAVAGQRAGLDPEAACRRALEPMRSVAFEGEAAVIAVDLRGRVGAAVLGRPSFPYAVWTEAGSELCRVDAF